jgi:hypothetical protein
MRRFEELLNWRVGSAIISVLALFGEEARGLVGGVEVSTFCRGGDVSSPSTGVSEATNVCDVLVRAATSAVGTSSSSSLQVKCRQYNQQGRHECSSKKKREIEKELTN